MQPQGAVPLEPGKAEQPFPEVRFVDRVCRGEPQGAQDDGLLARIYRGHRGAHQAVRAHRSRRDRQRHETADAAERPAGRVTAARDQRVERVEPEIERRVRTDVRVDDHVARLGWRRTDHQKVEQPVERRRGIVVVRIGNLGRLEQRGDHPRGPESARCAHGHVLHHAAVGERAAVEHDRPEHKRQRERRAHRLGQIAAVQHDFLSGRQVGGHRPERNGQRVEIAARGDVPPEHQRVHEGAHLLFPHGAGLEHQAVTTLLQHHERRQRPE
jgi:hypothetical protein